MQAALRAHEHLRCQRWVDHAHSPSKPGRDSSQYQRERPEESSARDRLSGCVGCGDGLLLSLVDGLPVLLLKFSYLRASLIDGDVLRLGNRLSRAFASVLLLL